MSLSTSSPYSDRTWATASRTIGERTIGFRFIAELGGPRPPRQSVRVFVLWRFESADGMPDPVARERMDQLEELLAAHLEEDGFATLVIVSTGDGLREWTFYAESSDELLHRVNAALAGLPPFPLEIHEADDPGWHYYGAFIAELAR